MPSPSPSASRLSIDRWGALLVACTIAAALVGVVALGFDNDRLAVAGLVASMAFFGVFALYLIVSERRRHESRRGRAPGADDVPRVARRLDRRCLELARRARDPRPRLRRGAQALRRRPRSLSCRRTRRVAKGVGALGERHARPARCPRRADRGARARALGALSPLGPRARDRPRRLRRARVRERPPARRRARARGRARQADGAPDHGGAGRAQPPLPLPPRRPACSRCPGSR